MSLHQCKALTDWISSTVSFMNFQEEMQLSVIAYLMMYLKSKLLIIKCEAQSINQFIYRTIGSRSVIPQSQINFDTSVSDVLDPYW